MAACKDVKTGVTMCANACGSTKLLKWEKIQVVCDGQIAGTRNDYIGCC
ncbi:hypothetical protein [Bacillus cereus]|nr:hypothetical protein [Bacillus cereus]